MSRDEDKGRALGRGNTRGLEKRAHDWDRTTDAPAVAAATPAVVVATPASRILSYGSIEGTCKKARYDDNMRCNDAQPSPRLGTPPSPEEIVVEHGGDDEMMPTGETVLNENAAADSWDADSGDADSGDADSGDADSGDADSGDADSGDADSVSSSEVVSVSVSISGSDVSLDDIDTDSDNDTDTDSDSDWHKIVTE
jgi:hypothetical protein